MTLFLRAATLLVLAGATGIAGWWTLILQDQIDGSEAELAERDDRIELLEDERRFIDLENSPLWLSEEQPIFGD